MFKQQTIKQKHPKYAHFLQVKFAQTFIATYENGTWSGSNPTRRALSKVLPRAELDRHRRQILKAMVKIRTQVRACKRMCTQTRA